VRAFLYFNKSVPGFTAATASGLGTGWNFDVNPLDPNGTGTRNIFWNYLNSNDLEDINKLKMEPSWYDYFWPLGGIMGGISTGRLNAWIHNN
jgi:hypothetical protein